MSDEAFTNVAGRTLTGIAISDDGESTLRLTFTDGDPHYVTTEGDCCSESWWADVIGASSCYGGVISEVRTVDMPEPTDNRTRQEHDSAYGYDIVTNRGIVNLVFRNSSNGYYGGWAFDTTYPPLDVWKEVVSNDWRA